MKRLDQVTKFAIITTLKTDTEKFKYMSVPEISNWIKTHYFVAVSTDSIYRWSTLYGFSFKKQKKKPDPDRHDIIKQTNQRIHILGMVIRNLCKELNVQYPSILDKLLNGITEQYGTFINEDIETQRLEEKVYDKI